MVAPGITVAPHSDLIPDDFTGDSFRVLFATSATRAATSADIADYNSFVQAAAGAGHAAIRAASSLFTAVASTAAVDARDNTATTYNNDDKGVPIYWLGGNQVADDYEDFYDGDWDDEADPRDESGDARSLTDIADRPFTGSNHDGTAATSGIFSSVLGTTEAVARVRVGRPGSGNPSHGPISSNSVADKTSERPLYALSPILRVGPQVTVPVDWALKPTGLASGDDFRLLFVTQATRNATATGIGVYNAFVQTRAAAGHEAIQGYASWFRVVGSTARHGRPRQHGDHPHRRRQGRAHLLARTATRSPTTTRTSTTGAGTTRPTRRTSPATRAPSPEMRAAHSPAASTTAPSRSCREPACRERWAAVQCEPEHRTAAAAPWRAIYSPDVPSRARSTPSPAC